MTEKTNNATAEPKNSPSKTTERPPVVAVLGHIDHGKSTLLDYIRKENTTDSEAGGITQHLSAYEVVHADKNGVKKKITFLDTPGHEAFQTLRSHVANAADIAILVVSAEDGVKEQTIEALKAIRESSVPFVVAINKTDKPEANVEKTISDLSEHEVYLEGRGGDVPYASVSAKTGAGVSELLELILLVAELSEFTGNPAKPAEGVVVEANRDPKRGITGTLIVKDGTLKIGMCVAAGNAVAPARLMENYAGQAVKEVSFSSPVRIIGFDSLPPVGEQFKTFSSKDEAERCASEASAKTRGFEGSSEADEEKAVIPIVIKTDVAGSIDAVIHEIENLKNDRIVLKIIHAEVGNITENDIQIAGGDKRAIVIGFNTRIDPGVKEMAERAGAELEVFNIIYDLSKWLSEVIKKKTPKILEEEVEGRAKILKVFSRTRDKQVVGGRVEQGKISIGDKLKIIRRDAQIGDGRVLELQQQKTPVKETLEGSEFGVKVESKTEIAVGDIIESTVQVEK